MRRLVHLVLTTLVLAAIIHIVVILAIPYVAPRDGWSRVMAAAATDGVTLLTSDVPGEEALPLVDPSMVYAVCRFDLSEGPYSISAPIPPHYWSISFHSREGVVFYAVNDEAALAEIFDLEVRNADQMRQFRTGEVPPVGEVLHIEAPADPGFALIRALVASRAEREEIEAIVSETRCETLRESREDAARPVVPLPGLRPE